MGRLGSEKIFCMTKTMVPVTKTMVSASQTILSKAETIFSVTKTMVSASQTILSSETTVTAAKKTVSVAPTVGCKVLSIAFMIVEQRFANLKLVFGELQPARIIINSGSSPSDPTDQP